MERIFDIVLGLHVNGATRRFRVYLPAALSDTLIDRGYDRATVTVTAEGILLRPYKASETHIPDWGDDG